VKRKPGTRKRATRTTARRTQLNAVVDLIREHQPLSRAEIARRLELNRGTVTSLVNQLLAENTIVEGHAIDAPRGRRPTMLYLRTRDRLTITVNLRFSRTAVALTDAFATHVAGDAFTTIFEPAALVAELAARIRALLQQHIVLGTLEGIEVRVPGTVDATTGRVLIAPQLGWRDVDLRTPLEQATDLPVSIENAAIAAAMSHARYARKPAMADDFVYLLVSDHIGTAVVSGGQVLRGANSSAGEFGHIPLHPAGPRCLCGSRGCWEMYASNLATLSRYLGRDPSLPETQAMLHAREFTMDDLIARAQSGDARARSAIAHTGRYIGLGIAMIVHALNPARVVVGGEVVGAWEMVERPIRSVLRRRVLTAATAETPIIPDAEKKNSP